MSSAEELETVVTQQLARYVERRDNGATPCAHDLLAVAAEFGSHAVDLAARGDGVLRADARRRARLIERQT
jgi:hypothetical protein